MKVFVVFLERILVTDELIGVFAKLEDAEQAAKETAYEDFKCYIEIQDVIE